MLDRNDIIQANICEVQIKSITNEFSDLLSDFTKIYGTPSTIKFNSFPKQTPAGIEYTNKLEVNFPGIKSTDFTNFNLLVHLKYIVRIAFKSNSVFEVGTNKIPLKLKTAFKAPKGTQLVFSNKTFIPVIYVGKLTDTDVSGFPYILKANL
ncbi:hypothetical protein [Tenacibaculum soleae]|uniref:hypothetical protein n=1 Tax=Tenacibaculum soleae TaxID=447689 RepID=UPI0023008DD1|nr:hypothetical protein [Tenacibaculum soleae]